ncbi:hypothetical protein LguiA_003571 [Lonicera macranthoides]
MVSFVKDTSTVMDMRPSIYGGNLQHERGQVGRRDEKVLGRQKAFHGEDCPPELEKDGEVQWFTTCSRVGGTREKSTRVWSQMADNVNWLWIAGGFIEQDKSRKLEDVAEEYMEDLVDRSLIMVAPGRCDGGVKSCFIHDLLHDLCISEGIKENFLGVHTELLTRVLDLESTRVLGVPTQVEKLHICSNAAYASEGDTVFPNLRKLGYIASLKHF